MKNIKEHLFQDVFNLVVLGIIAVLAVVMLFHGVPDTNRENISTIVGGLLGILVGRVTTNKTGTTINE